MAGLVRPRVRALSVVGAVVLLAGAFAVTRTEPGEKVGFAPFAVHVEQGELGRGRNLEAVVDGVTLADRVVMDDWTGETSGVWLVVDVRMATTQFGTLAHADLFAGDRRWRPSSRPNIGAMQSTSLDAGLPMAGSFVFELPVELLRDDAGRHAALELSTRGDTRLDSVVRLDLDLTALPHEDVREVADAERAP